MHRAMVYLGLSDDYDDYAPGYDDPAPAPAVSARRQADPVEQAQVSVVRPVRAQEAPEAQSGVSVTPRPAVVRPISPLQSAKVHVVAPVRFSDAQEVGDRFKNSQPVIVNLQNADPPLSRRMIDFCSGVTYALGGSMDKVADQVFLLTPSNVEVSAEEKRRLEERGLYRS
ncbi:MAG TPA: cell division protein SepF [Acidimicrobiales bacterium]|nr:cell division protein SepF [Acidimicrobiales bacterium]